MNEILQNSVFFGLALSIVAYWIGTRVKQKLNWDIVNPLLVAAILVIALLYFSGISYETYKIGAQYITFLLTPATVCLAIPLYKNVILLKQHIVAILIAITCGVIAHLVSIVTLGAALHLDDILVRSLLAKSVTSPIAMGIADEIGGIVPITMIGVTIAGMIGAIVGPGLLKIIGIKEPIAQGIAIGTAAHVLGTSRAVELGEIQGAMSSLAIVVTGILTVIIVPLVLPYLGC